MGEEGWSVGLGLLKPGVHSIELDASLVPRQRDCVRDDLSLWLVVDEESTVEHAPGGAGTVPLRALPARWREVAPESVAVLAPQGDVHASRAAVRADHMLRSWGLEVEHPGVRSGAAAGPRVELATRTSAPASWTELDAKLDDAPRAAGVVEGSSSVLRVLARTEEELPQVVLALASAQFRQLCGEGACLVADTDGKNPASARRDQERMGPDVAMTLTAAGFPDGWEARGGGRHVLAFDWSPPAGAVIERWPVLHLPVRWSGGQAGRDAVLSVRIAGRGVASFDLEDFEANETTELAVRVPRAWWSRTSWPIEVEVSLGGDQERCEENVGGLPWLVIEPEAALRVPYAAPPPTGIAGWYARRIADGETVPVVWPSVATPAQTHQVAAFLFPLSVVGGGPGYAFEGAGEAVPAVHVVMDPSASSGIRGTQSGSTAHWLDEGGIFSLPLVDSSRTAYLGLAGPGLEFVPATLAEGAPVPPLGGMIGRKALLTRDGRWETFDVPAQPAPRRAVSEEARPSSEMSAPQSRESRARRMLNLVWLLCSAIIVGLVILTLRRRASR